MPLFSDFGRIAQGNYNNTIDIERHDEIGKLMEALKSMQIKLGFDVAESKRIADESLRIKTGLDSSTSAITISGTDTLLIHMTPAAKSFLPPSAAPNSMSKAFTATASPTCSTILRLPPNSIVPRKPAKTWTCSSRIITPSGCPSHPWRKRQHRWAGYRNGRIAPPKSR